MARIPDRIVEFRTEAGLNQSDLAKAVGVSQATISRIEKSGTDPTDLGMVIRIANALSIPVIDLVADTDLEAQFTSRDEEEFIAFCPCILCSSNKTWIDEDGDPWVRWTSSSSYSRDDYDNVQYCMHCGTRLVKACPSCGMGLRTKGQRYCTRCGTVLAPEITDKQWDAVKRIHSHKHAAPPDDDIPF